MNAAEARNMTDDARATVPNELLAGILHLIEETAAQGMDSIKEELPVSTGEYSLETQDMVRDHLMVLGYKVDIGPKACGHWTISW